MKDPLERTKVVVRRLPPGISQHGFVDQIEGRFSGRYKWMCFYPGKNSQKNQRYARAYVNFNKPEDVVEFAEFFNGHVFVNEKGSQFKAVVEYAPSQQVPNEPLKKDGREGTIYKDHEYVKFLELLAKPVENLPSAEIQLERKEAELAGGVKEMLIVTPLMDFVRKKRAAKTMSQRSIVNGKLGRKPGGVSSHGSGSASSKLDLEKGKSPASMYVLRDGAKNAGSKENSSVILVSRRKGQRLVEKTVGKAYAKGAGAVTNGTVSGTSEGGEAGKQRVILLKGKERERPIASSGSTLSGSSTFKQNPRSEANGRIRSILSKEARRYEQNVHTRNLEKDNRPPLPPIARLISRDRNCVSVISDGDKKSDGKLMGNDLHYPSEKQAKRTRNKNRPDRGVWAPLRQSYGSRGGEEPCSSLPLSGQVPPESSESTFVSQQENRNTVNDYSGAQVAQSEHVSGSVISCNLPLSRVDMKTSNRNVEGRIIVAGYGNAAPENGLHKHIGRHPPVHGVKDFDGFTELSEGKHSRKAGAGYISNEKQVWVQRTGSG